MVRIGWRVTAATILGLLVAGYIIMLSRQARCGWGGETWLDVTNYNRHKIDWNRQARRENSWYYWPGTRPAMNPFSWWPPIQTSNLDELARPTRVGGSNSNSDTAASAFCDIDFTYHQLGALRVDAAALARSVAYPSSAIRLRRVFDRVIAGESITVAIIGGSISAHKEGIVTYADTFFKWLRARSPTSTNQPTTNGTEDGPHVLINGAIPATGSSFFRYCAEQQIGDHVDLILLEIAANDVGGDVNAPGGLFTRDDAAHVQMHEEALLRRLLNLPSHPAIALIHFGWLREYENAQEPLNALAAFYDIPALSYKNMLFGWLMSAPMTAEDPPTSLTQDIDPRDTVHARVGEVMIERLHPSSRGHAQLAWSLVHFIQTHVLQCDRDSSSLAAQAALDPGSEILPGDRRLAADTADEPLANSLSQSSPPGCLTVQGLHPNLKPVEFDDNGWRLYEWKRSGREHETTGKIYWQGVRPGARITFAATVHRAHSRVYVYSLVAPYLHSTAACWLEHTLHLDEQEDPHIATIRSFNSGPSDVAVGVKHLVGVARAPGKYHIICEMRTGRDFRLIAILYD